MAQRQRNSFVNYGLGVRVPSSALDLFSNNKIRISSHFCDINFLIRSGFYLLILTGLRTYNVWSPNWRDLKYNISKRTVWSGRSGVRCHSCSSRNLTCQFGKPIWEWLRQRSQHASQRCGPRWLFRFTAYRLREAIKVRLHKRLNVNGLPQSVSGGVDIFANAETPAAYNEQAFGDRLPDAGYCNGNILGSYPRDYGFNSHSCY